MLFPNCICFLSLIDPRSGRLPRVLENREEDVGACLLNFFFPIAVSVRFFKSILQHSVVVEYVGLPRSSRVSENREEDLVKGICFLTILFPIAVAV